MFSKQKHSMSLFKKNKTFFAVNAFIESLIDRFYTIYEKEAAHHKEFYIEAVLKSLRVVESLFSQNVSGCRSAISTRTYSNTTFFQKFCETLQYSTHLLHEIFRLCQNLITWFIKQTNNWQVNTRGSNKLADNDSLTLLTSKHKLHTVH